MKQSMLKMSTEIATMPNSIKSTASINQPTLPKNCNKLTFNQLPSCAARSDASHAAAVSGNLSQVVKSAIVETLCKEKAVECGHA